MREAVASSFDLQSKTGVVRPSSILLPSGSKRVGRERKKTAGNSSRRVVIDQPPHYGRVGMQITPPVRVSRAEHDAMRAVQTAQFEREHQTLKYGARATVRSR